MKLTDEQINGAVDWWANALRNPKFDNGDDSPIGGLAMMLAITGRRGGPTEAQIATFKELLTAELAKEMDEYDDLSTDYHPCSELSLCADVAGIDDSHFPWKTIMNFRNGNIQVAYGYGAKLVELLPKAVG